MNQTRRTLDTSTIDLGKLRTKPIYTLPPIYHLQSDPGNGCAGDPPGYPTYFTRSVYNAAGNTPRNAPQYVILDGGTVRVVISKDAPYDNWQNTLRALWKPLPEDHPRTQAWTQATYAHHAHCYRDVDGLVAKPEYGRPGTLIYPITGFWETSYGLRKFKDDLRFSDEWRATKQESIRLNNERILDLIDVVAKPENHSAVAVIRQYYPSHAPRLDYIEKAPENPGNWWETSAKPPTPETCPGQYSNAHPVNGSWCQWCGWRAPKEVAA